MVSCMWCVVMRATGAIHIPDSTGARHGVCIPCRTTNAETLMDAKQKATSFIDRPMRPGRPGARLKGSLVIIGGHEDRDGDKKILRAVVDRLGRGGKIVVSTAASREPEPLWKQYEAAFRALGV